MVKIHGSQATLELLLSLDYKEVTLSRFILLLRLRNHKIVFKPEDNPRYVEANAGCKHFDVYAGPDDSRNVFDAKVLNLVYWCTKLNYCLHLLSLHEVAERDWRMTFLPQFKACVKAGSWSLMCSVNQ